MVRDLMVACVERRFGISKTAHPVEWLSDNGSAYIAKDTLDTERIGVKQSLRPKAVASSQNSHCLREDHNENDADANFNGTAHSVPLIVILHQDETQARLTNLI